MDSSLEAAGSFASRSKDDQAQVHTPPSVSPTPSHATGLWSYVCVRFINKASDVRLLVLHGAHCWRGMRDEPQVSCRAHPEQRAVLGSQSCWSPTAVSHCLVASFWLWPEKRLRVQSVKIMAEESGNTLMHDQSQSYSPLQHSPFPTLSTGLSLHPVEHFLAKVNYQTSGQG